MRNQMFDFGEHGNNTIFFLGYKGTWMYGLRIYVFFNNISVISGRWMSECEELCAMKRYLVWTESRLQPWSEFLEC